MRMAACVRGYHSDTAQDTQHVLFPLTLASSLQGNKNSVYRAPVVCQHNSKLGFKEKVYLETLKFLSENHHHVSKLILNVC